MGCAAASLTPPNVSAASLEGDALRSVGPVNSSASNSTALACRLDKDVKVTCLLNYTEDLRVCVCARGNHLLLHVFIFGLPGKATACNSHNEFSIMVNCSWRDSRSFSQFSHRFLTCVFAAERKEESSEAVV